MDLLLETAEQLAAEEQEELEAAQFSMDFSFLHGVRVQRGARSKQRRKETMHERQLVHLREAAVPDDEQMVAEALFDLANMNPSPPQQQFARGNGRPRRRGSSTGYQPREPNDRNSLDGYHAAAGYDRDRNQDDGYDDERDHYPQHTLQPDGHHHNHNGHYQPPFSHITHENEGKRSRGGHADGRNNGSSKRIARTPPTVHENVNGMSNHHAHSTRLPGQLQHPSNMRQRSTRPVLEDTAVVHGNSRDNLAESQRRNVDAAGVGSGSPAMGWPIPMGYQMMPGSYPMPKQEPGKEQLPPNLPNANGSGQGKASGNHGQHVTGVSMGHPAFPGASQHPGLLGPHMGKVMPMMLPDGTHIPMAVGPDGQMAPLPGGWAGLPAGMQLPPVTAPGMPAPAQARAGIQHHDTSAPVQGIPSHQGTHQDRQMRAGSNAVVQGVAVKTETSGQLPQRGTQQQRQNRNTPDNKNRSSLIHVHIAQFIRKQQKVQQSGGQQPGSGKAAGPSAVRQVALQQEDGANSSSGMDHGVTGQHDGITSAYRKGNTQQPPRSPTVEKENSDTAPPSPVPLQNGNNSFTHDNARQHGKSPLSADGARQHNKTTGDQKKTGSNTDETGDDVGRVNDGEVDTGNVAIGQPVQQQPWQTNNRPSPAARSQQPPLSRGEVQGRAVVVHPAQAGEHMSQRTPPGPAGVPAAGLPFGLPPHMLAVMASMLHTGLVGHGMPGSAAGAPPLPPGFLPQHLQLLAANAQHPFPALPGMPAPNAVRHAVAGPAAAGPLPGAVHPGLLPGMTLAGLPAGMPPPLASTGGVLNHHPAAVGIVGPQPSQPPA